MSRPCPVPDELLTDYFAGDAVDADGVEDHVFACDRCAGAFERAGRLAARLRDLVQPVIGRDRLERMIAQGTPIRVTSVSAGERVTVEFARDLALLVHALRADLAGVSRVDMELLAPDGTRLLAMSHVPFDRERGEILIACQKHYMGVFPPRSWFRLFAVADEERRSLGEYVVDHVVP
jgi:hypothetical protein